MAGSPSDPGRSGLRPALRVLLFASLALNLLIVGAVAGALWRGGPARGPEAGASRDFAAPYARALAPEDRRALRRDLRRAMLANRPERGALAEGYARASAALRADPFDPAALEAALAGQAERARRRQEVGREVMVAFLSALSAEERRAFADRLDAEIARLSARSRAWRHDR